MTQPAAGWYPDPSDPSRQRYFDGKTWTDNYAPFGPPTQAVRTAPKSGMPRGLKIGLVKQWNGPGLVKPADDRSAPSAHTNGSQQCLNLLRSQVPRMLVQDGRGNTMHGWIGLNTDSHASFIKDESLVVEQLTTCE